MVGIGDVAGDRDHASEPGDCTLESRRPRACTASCQAALRKGTSKRESETTRCAGDDSSHTHRDYKLKLT